MERNVKRLGDIATDPSGPEVRGIYKHWDHLRHLTPPDGMTTEQWWFGIKLARMTQQRRLPLLDKQHRPFGLTLSDGVQRRLFQVARDAAGALRGEDRIQSDTIRERYLVRSLMEEAMTSSQLEGAAMTTQVAKDMLRSGRQPRDYGERMIWNNYAAMRELKRWRQCPLTPDAIFEMHRMLTDGTLDKDQAGRFRRPDEDIVIEDETGQVLHVPPLPASCPGACRRCAISPIRGATTSLSSIPSCAPSSSTSRWATTIRFVTATAAPHGRYSTGRCCARDSGWPSTCRSRAS